MLASLWHLLEASVDAGPQEWQAHMSLPVNIGLLESFGRSCNPVRLLKWPFHLLGLSLGAKCIAVTPSWPAQQLQCNICAVKSKSHGISVGLRRGVCVAAGPSSR